jgi:hypothetical protein
MSKVQSRDVLVVESVGKVPKQILCEMWGKKTSQNAPQSTISCLGRVK